MKRISYVYKLALGLTIVTFLNSCRDDDDVSQSLEVPESYVFERDGESSVSYSGQTDRLNMLAEIKNETKKADAGEEVESSVLLNMYGNDNEPFADGDLNASTKNLEDKTFVADVQFFKDLMNDLGVQSELIAQNGATATQGEAGLLDRDGNGKTILVNDKGWEYTQLIEKGLMGSVFY
ncbi:MAG: DUF4856 domain-containing protein, partial [Cyclobacteriaceae bacterium]